MRAGCGRLPVATSFNSPVAGTYPFSETAEAVTVAAQKRSKVLFVPG